MNKIASEKNYKLLKSAAEYKGRKVSLNKPFRTPKGPKKFSVYVRNKKGNVIKVNFGDPDMEIKRDDPDNRRSFRARHKCSEKKDKTKPGYWSCKMWGKNTVKSITKKKSSYDGAAERLKTLEAFLRKKGFLYEADLCSNQISKLAVPRDEGPLWEQPVYNSEYYDEDFYPDLDSDEIERETEFDNLYHGRNVVWIGSSGKMVRADAHYVYPIQGNIFYDEKISQLTDKINASSEKVILYAPYGDMSKVDLNAVEESIGYQEDYGHAALTTGDDDLDEYLKDKEEYLNDNAEYDDEYEIVAESYDKLKSELELQLKEAEESGSGDLGKFIFQIRDGNHRAFAAIEAGEKYIWIKISDNQMQNIEEGSSWVAGYKDVLE